MGDQRTHGQELSGGELRAFLARLLADLRALEEILSAGWIEEGVRRVGAEQELFLVDRNWRPANLAAEVLSRLDDPAFSHELGLFNLEINLEPFELRGSCFRDLEHGLEVRLARLRDVVASLGASVVLVGILPTLRNTDLGLEAMTPSRRFAALNAAITRLRGGDYEFHIKGLDELLVKHDSVMVEACNASFQVHLQVGAREFANVYNVAQAVAGAVLSCATNSPVLFGRRLWSETRIALFQQAVDTRNFGRQLRERSPRVGFGRGWVRDSVLELFREDVARFRALVGNEGRDGPEDVVARGEVPSLEALTLHNSTVWRWNRPCYGRTAGRPHLRIENRVLPAGPSVVDEVANAALWTGLVHELSHRHPDITELMSFDDALANFRAAARFGMNAQLTWLGGDPCPAPELVERELLPAARLGLARMKVDAADIDRYLGVVEERVRVRQCGARWILGSLVRMREHGTPGEQMTALTAAIARRQASGVPVARWEPAEIEEGGGWRQNFSRVEHFMSTDLYTLHADEPIDLAASLMEWERIRHLPVEDDEGRLVGLVSYRALLRVLARDTSPERTHAPISEIMRRDPVTIAPEAPTWEAIERMRRLSIGCLPVVRDGRLVGMVTEREFLRLASDLLRAVTPPIDGAGGLPGGDDNR